MRQKFYPPYYLNIIDGNVDIPEDIDIEYSDPDVAYEVLAEFVHSFDGIKQVDGRVCDRDGEDYDYSSSIM